MVTGIPITVLFLSFLATGGRRESWCRGDACHCSVSSHWDTDKGGLWLWILWPYRWDMLLIVFRSRCLKDPHWLAYWNTGRT
jgi:hypothetical protein